MIPDLRIPVWRMRRRLCSCVTLLAYLIAAIGYPLPVAKASQRASPCGQQVCGCGSVEQCQAGGCCCSHSRERPEQDATPSCCSKRTPKPAVKPSSSVKDQTPANANYRWVVGISALKCQGAATHWITAQAALPTAAPLSWQPIWPFCYSLPVTHHSRFVLSADLLDPPPRFEAI
jgi:hypothetical protein